MGKHTTPATRADARNRAWRTLLQGLATDVLVALAAVLLAWLPDAAPHAGPRALLLREADRLHCKDRDPFLARSLGFILGGCLILGWALLRFLDTIGV